MSAKNILEKAFNWVFCRQRLDILRELMLLEYDGELTFKLDGALKVDGLARDDPNEKLEFVAMTGVEFEGAVELDGKLDVEIPSDETDELKALSKAALEINETNVVELFVGEFGDLSSSAWDDIEEFGVETILEETSWEELEIPLELDGENPTEISEEFEVTAEAKFEVRISTEIILSTRELKASFSLDKISVFELDIIPSETLEG